MSRRRIRLLSTRRRGVALIEALIALVVMGLGILALVGVQATLRQNSDVARERAEATRIATDEMEVVRSFIAVAPVAGQPGVSWDEIASRTVDPVPLPAGASNVSYRMVRTVTTQGATQKSVNVLVSWTDRTGTAQSVTFDSVLTAASPVLSALLFVPTQASAIAQRSGRHPTIPPQAVDLGAGSGQSAFKPVESGTVAWVFDNLTGLIVSLCSGTAAATSAALTNANLGVCIPASATLLAGTVNFNLRGASSVLSADASKSVFKPVAAGTVAWVLNNAAKAVAQIQSVAAGSSTASLANGADVLNPWAGPAPALPQAVSPFDSAVDPGYVLGAADSDTSNPAAPIVWPQLNFGLTLTAGSTNVASWTCYSNAPTAVAAVNTQTPATYYCAVTAADATGWGGEFDLAPAGYSDGGGVAWSTGATSSTYKVCRYTTAAGDTTRNTDHPKYYCKVSGAACTAKVTTNLVNQNFLVIAGSKSCPTDVAANPAAGDLVNSSTLQHQP